MNPRVRWALAGAALVLSAGMALLVLRRARQALSYVHPMRVLARAPGAEHWLVEGAGHGGYAEVDPAGLERHLGGFFDGALGAGGSETRRWATLIGVGKSRFARGGWSCPVDRRLLSARGWPSSWKKRSAPSYASTPS